MSFLPGLDDWISSHVEHIPGVTRNFCGDLDELSVLDVGCGDMIADVGLLKLNPKHIDGLDVLSRPFDVVDHAVKEIRQRRFSVPSDYASRLRYHSYDGKHFPFPDDHFDFVFSWSAFEHIDDVGGVLGEIRRVVKPFGRVFIQVYPWFQTFLGSHLTDFIQEPFFHLRRSDEWVRQQLQECRGRDPELTDEVVTHLFTEYEHLNRYSARQFLAEVLRVGFAVYRCESTFNEDQIEHAPAEIPLADIVTMGTQVLLWPGKPFSEQQLFVHKLQDDLRKTKADLNQALVAHERDRALIAGIVESKSWKITKPVRSFLELLREFK